MNDHIIIYRAGGALRIRVHSSLGQATHAILSLVTDQDQEAIVALGRGLIFMVENPTTKQMEVA